MILDARREPAFKSVEADHLVSTLRSTTFEPVVTAHAKRLHQLSWNAGHFMHDEWWAHLGLDNWRAIYRSMPACRTALDRAIAGRRGFPIKPLSSGPDSAQCRLLDLEPRLVSLCAALGLIELDCADYLLFKTYRQALTPLIGARGCDQILALKGPRQNAAAAVAPVEDICDAAVRAGVLWLNRELAACEVWRAVSIRLPPVTSAEKAVMVPSRSSAGSALSILFRLERFL